MGASHLLDQCGVVGDAGVDGDILEVLGRGANHRGTPDVDVFDQMAEGDAGLRGGLFEGVEIHDHHVDRLNAVCGDGCFVLGVAADVEQAPMDEGMQSLDPAVENLGEARQVADVLHAERPASRSAFRVPPVETSSTPKPASVFANSTRPVLSVTLSRARRMRLSLFAVTLVTPCDPCASARAKEQTTLRACGRHGTGHLWVPAVTDFNIGRCNANERSGIHYDEDMGSSSQVPQPEILPPAVGYAAPQPEVRRRSQWAATPATYSLVAVNCLVFLAMTARHVSPWSPTTEQLFGWGANHAGAVLVGGEWWRILTAMFVHVGIVHLATNMWCLWNLGLLAEPLMGSAGVIAVYVLSGRRRQPAFDAGELGVADS